MLKEIRTVRQIHGEPRRRWFTSDTMDLVVWCGDGDRPIGFQLCYDKGSAERALNWSEGAGYSHLTVDDGEGAAALRYKQAPILLADGEFDRERLEALFMANSAQLPQLIAAFVSNRIIGYRSAK